MLILKELMNYTINPNLWDLPKQKKQSRKNHKSKSEGLTPDEKQEQVKLREAYIESVRANMRRQLNNIDVKRPDGSIVSLKEQAAQNLAKKKKHAN